jgi:hypothetical protein
MRRRISRRGYNRDPNSLSIRCFALLALLVPGGIGIVASFSFALGRVKIIVIVV